MAIVFFLDVVRGVKSDELRFSHSRARRFVDLDESLDNRCEKKQIVRLCILGSICVTGQCGLHAEEGLIMAGACAVSGPGEGSHSDLTIGWTMVGANAFALTYLKIPQYTLNLQYSITARTPPFQKHFTTSFPTQPTFSPAFTFITSSYTPSRSCSRKGPICK